MATTPKVVVQTNKVSVGIIIIFIITLLAFIGALLWAIYSQSQLENLSYNLLQNPFCLRYYCYPKTAGEDPNVVAANKMTLIDLPVEQDPQRRAFVTSNWCILNAPFETLQEQLQVCAANDISANEVSPELRDNLESMIDFYVDKYMPYCGFTWRTADAVTVNNNDPGANEFINGNNTITSLNGINDTFLLALYNCSNKVLGSQNTSVVKARQTCGPPCGGV